jgi:hypothetical protein
MVAKDPTTTRAINGQLLALKCRRLQTTRTRTGRFRSKPYRKRDASGKRPSDG